MKQWEIAPGSRICQVCERRFDPDEQYWSVISETDAGYVRKDYCEVCQASAEPVEGPISVWRTINRVAPKLPRVNIDPVNAFELLETFSATDPEDPRQKLAYLLALLLMRRKVIRYEGIEEGHLLFKRGGRRKVWRVQEFNFKPEEMDEIQEELSALLELDEASVAEGQAPQPEGSPPDGGDAGLAENS